jgi:hypothetical protein
MHLGRLERLQLESATARIRHDWAKGEALRNPASPALTTYIAESLEECRILAIEIENFKARLKPSKPLKKTN